MRPARLFHAEKGLSGGRKRGSNAPPKKARGMFSVEFGLITLIALTLFAVVGEFLRVSLYDQTLARATHLSAQAVGRLPVSSGCAAAVTNAFAADGTARWLFDANNDGTVTVGFTTADGWPAADANEVQVSISWDGNPTDGVDWSEAVAGQCGDTGSWLRVRSRLAVRPWFAPFRAAAPNGVVLNHESWARNNRS